MFFARIADWIETQQPWLSDAAGRLLVNGRIDDAEIGEIIALAKSPAGIDDPAGRVAQPLTRDLLPSGDAATNPITLLALRSLRWVKAIAADQSILFSLIGVTVVCKRSTNDAAQSKVVERVMSDSEVGQRRSAGIFQGSSAS
ncbi:MULTISPECIES: hypothetical protein [unclassified Caballeronia]|uniref:hypothetical protein n=1 Tax=unclassified Caballeronia TaxID=2646786 RepID=UPI0020284C72|nr:MULTISPECIES: hypothetical protein [unclassified Caballeronia]